MSEEPFTVDPATNSFTVDLSTDGCWAIASDRCTPPLESWGDIVVAGTLLELTRRHAEELATPRVRGDTRELDRRILALGVARSRVEREAARRFVSQHALVLRGTL